MLESVLEFGYILPAFVAGGCHGGRGGGARFVHGVWCGRARRVRAGRAERSNAVGLVGRVGCARDMRGAEGRRACVAGEEEARRMSPGS